MAASLAISGFDKISVSLIHSATLLFEPSCISIFVPFVLSGEDHEQQLINPAEINE